MKYYGEFTAGKTVYVSFNTRATATGAPITLGGTPAVSVYKRGSTTESTTGVTLTVDYDARTGYHVVAIDTSADVTFYASANDFDVVITTGTVDSVSVVGVCVGTFSLSNRAGLRPTTADRTLDVSAGGEAGVDWANVGSPTTTVGLSGTTVKTATDVETDTADIQARLPAALTAGGNMKADALAWAGGATATDDIALVTAPANLAGLSINGSGQVTALLADGAHGGSASVLTLERIIVASTTLNEPAFTLTGNGSAPGWLSTGGSTGDGAKFVGGASGGNGLQTVASATGFDGVHSLGFGSGRGAHFLGGSVSGVGLRVEGQGTGAGMEFISATTAAAITIDPASGAAVNVVNGTVDLGTVSAAITGNITGSLSGSAGSVTGNVGGNVVGSVGSIAAGGIAAASFATDAITSTALAASAVTEIQAGLSTLDASGVRSAIGMAAATYDTDIAALPTAAENATELLDQANGIETGYTVRQTMRAIAAKAAGLVSGAGTGTEVIKALGAAAGGTTRLTATVSAAGDISAWTLNL